jgi:hypothetical protein
MVDNHDLTILSRCLHQGYTGTIIRYIVRKEITEFEDIKDLLNRSVKYFIKNNLDINKDKIPTLNSTIKSILIWYKIKTE